MEFFRNKKNLYILICTCVAIICIIVCLLIEHNDNNSEYQFVPAENKEISTGDAKINNESDDKIYVYVIGEVNNTGVIEANYGDRLKDIIEKAGGFTPEADTKKINLAYQVEDGQKIVIPNINDLSDNESVGDDYITTGAGINALQGQGGAAKVNINRATQTELETLSGIGPSMANKIIDYRNKNGKFSSIDELKNVPGIGEAKFESIREYVVVK